MPKYVLFHVDILYVRAERVCMFVYVHIYLNLTKKRNNLMNVLLFAIVRCLCAQTVFAKTKRALCCIIHFGLEFELVNAKAVL